MKKANIVVSDLHVGSFSGMMPDGGITLDNGATLSPSKAQNMLLEFWAHFWNVWLPEKTKDCKKIHVTINGDVIDGNHHNAVDLIPNVKDQRRAAQALLKPIRAKYPMAMVRGTEAHGGISEQDTEEIAKDLDCIQDKETGNYSWYQYWLDIDGVLFQHAHHIGVTSSAAYETSAPMRELVSGLIESAQWGQRLPNIFVRSHRHRYVPVSIPTKENSDISLYITPGWQLRTPHVERIDRMRMSHIGGICFICEDGLWTVKRKIYELPKPTVNQM